MVTLIDREGTISTERCIDIEKIVTCHTNIGSPYEWAPGIKYLNILVHVEFTKKCFQKCLSTYKKGAETMKAC